MVVNALVGNFGFGPGEKGISIFRYDPGKAGFQHIQNYLQDVSVGLQALDPVRNIVYIVNECRDRRGQVGGGGYLIAAKVDPVSDTFTVIGEMETLASLPSYVWVDGTRSYCLVAHHVSGDYITKIQKSPDGTYKSTTLFDDSALVLFHLNTDGSLGNISDVAIVRGDATNGNKAIPRLHSAVGTGNGDLIVVCDKGSDKLYSYAIDRITSMLLLKGEMLVESGSAPRYGVFHPTKSVFFLDYEEKTTVDAYAYTASNGKLSRISSCRLLLDKSDGSRPSDLLAHPNGRILYVSIRDANLIAVLRIGESGELSLAQNIESGGKNPRGLRLSPDGRFLFAMHQESGTIVGFPVSDDGTLALGRVVAETNCPGNMVFVTSRQ